MPYPWKDLVPRATQGQLHRSLHVRPGGRLPLLDLPAGDGFPAGFRQARLLKEARQAREELEGRLSDRVLELGLSFYAVKSRHGAARNGVLLRGRSAPETHKVTALPSLPACRALLQRALKVLGLSQLSAAEAESRCNGLARRYRPGQALPRHVDNAMFEDTIVGVVLQSSPMDGLRLCQETPSPEGSMTLLAQAKGLDGLKARLFAELGFRLSEADGLCFCLQGPARDLAHEVPAVRSERVSITFRWFRKDFLEELERLEASLDS